MAGIAYYGSAGTSNAASGANFMQMLYLPTMVTRRFMITSIMFGTGAVPAENSCLYDVYNSTAVPTGGAAFSPVPQPSDPDAPACITLTRTLSTGVATQGNKIMSIPVHQKATFKWAADQGGEIYPDSDASDGIGIVSNPSASSWTQQVTWCFFE